MVSSIITMYNMWCLLWPNIALKWQFDNPPPCRKHGSIVKQAWMHSQALIHYFQLRDARISTSKTILLAKKVKT